jgi:hypothetical protein
VFHEFVFLIGGADDQDRAGVRDRLCHILEK